MRISEIFEKYGGNKKTITAALEAEIPGITLADKELKVVVEENIEFDEKTLEGKDLIVYSQSLAHAYRLKKASMKHIDQLAKVVPNMVVIVYK